MKQRSSTGESTKKHSRQGSALILSVILMFTLFGFLAFSIDVGYISQTRAEMRRAADAAALAGCWELYSQMASGMNEENAYGQVRLASAQIAALNPICRITPTLDPSDVSQDIKIGYLDSTQQTEISNDASKPYYAVRVEVAKTAEKSGQVPYFFGQIFGKTGRDMHANATAVLAKQISGFASPPTASARLNVLPFAIDSQTWDALLAQSARDDYRFDAETGRVVPGSDGIQEVNLYPQGTGSPGNRGTVDIGKNNNSTKDIARQIVDGISAQDLVDLGKPLLLNSFEQLTLNGDTGISAGVKDELASIIGEKRIIPVFSELKGNGNNANYTIVKWVGVRILDVKLTGKMSGKKLVVQPAPVMVDYGIVASSGENWSDFLYSSVILAR